MLIYSPWNLHSSWKWMVGILVSFWDGLFSGAMLVWGSVSHRIKPSKNITGRTLVMKPVDLKVTICDGFFWLFPWYSFFWQRCKISTTTKKEWVVMEACTPLLWNIQVKSVSQSKNEDVCMQLLASNDKIAHDEVSWLQAQGNSTWLRQPNKSNIWSSPMTHKGHHGTSLASSTASLAIFSSMTNACSNSRFCFYVFLQKDSWWTTSGGGFPSVHENNKNVHPKNRPNRRKSSICKF